jgi:hypothetical protein
MGSFETPVEQFNTNIIQMGDIAAAQDETTLPASSTESGALKVSGAKLYISDSAAWNIVTSA